LNNFDFSDFSSHGSQYEGFLHFSYKWVDYTTQGEIVAKTSIATGSE